MTNEADNANLLDPFETRVLAVLAEKEALTPDNYPMSLNAITNGCNQLSSRDPVMSISEETVADVLRIKWSLEQDKVAVLTVLMLRGLQTAGEIRTRTGRLHDFKSVADVELALQFLIDKYPPLAAKLPLAPGTKEPRYGHLLQGEEALAREETAASYGGSTSTPAQGSRVAQLEAEVAQLRQDFTDLAAQFEQFKKQFE
jgi:uncharacterized protein YceH (UPF0502 family)